MMAQAPLPQAQDSQADDAIRWEAVIARDKAFDGQFVYAVKTTGVFCRPSCGARLPLRENVGFYATPALAAESGFRPCKRCRPEAPEAGHGPRIAAAIGLIERAETPPSLDAVAAAAGLSPHHFHRVFKAATGMTPKAYADAHRARLVRQALPEARSVTEAIYDGGFNSSGRFYEAANGMLGMTPTAFRAGGRGETIRFALGACSLGAILVAATARGVCAILLGDDPAALLQQLQDRFARATLVGDDPSFDAVVAQVVGFVDAPETGLGLALDVRGTAFQHRVWAALRAIPVGSTETYSALAARLGQPGAVRAVASACAANSLAVAIPCHRVVRLNGDLAGYRWGLARKAALLAREGAR
jgi:AraC family transcriptional regulator of adaptative response/methylated-DNA-[protein]-cysteine methyltransferase